MVMRKLNRGEMAVIIFSKNQVMDMIKENIIENIQTLTQIENDITELVVSVQFNDKDGSVTAKAVEDSECDMMTLDYSALLSKMFKQGNTIKNKIFYLRVDDLEKM